MYKTTNTPRANLAQLRFDIEKEGESVFPFTYLYSIYEKHLPVAADKDRLYVHALKIARNQVLKEAMKNFIAIYHFNSLIPKNILRREKMQTIFSHQENPLADYDANVTVTMTTVYKLIRTLYLNLLDLRLADYLLLEDVAPLGAPILNLGEDYYKQIYVEMAEKELDFNGAEYHRRSTVFIQFAIENMRFAEKDKPAPKNLRDDVDRDERYMQVLKGVTHALGIATGLNYYDAILQAEQKMLTELYWKEKEEAKNKVYNIHPKKKGFFSRLLGL